MIYTATVYEWLSRTDKTPLGIFDVVIEAENNLPCASHFPRRPHYKSDLNVVGTSHPYRRQVYSYVAHSDKNVAVDTLTAYCYWKYAAFQHETPMVPNVKVTRGIYRYTLVHKSLEWIKLSIDVEFDYHLGEAKYLQPEHADTLKKYLGTAKDLADSPRW